MLASLPSEAQVLQRVLAWAADEPSVRAVLLSSSRARPEPGVDALSDYDLILALPEPALYAADRHWRAAAYGPELLCWGDQKEQAGQMTYFRGVIYADFVKIDWSLWPVALLEAITAAGKLPDELDAGYRVLQDKEGLTAAWPAAGYRAFRPTPPTAAEYQALVEEFWFGVSYVAKSLWRDDFLFMRWVMDNDLKLVTLRRLLEWRIALDHGWTLRPGVLGRGLRQRLPPDLWQALEATYVGPEPADNWEALLRLMGLFRRAAQEVGAAFGYPYPEPVERQMRAYVEALRAAAVLR